ncbi:MAG: serine/threonine-protein kinase [Myxococcales bacterium]
MGGRIAQGGMAEILAACAVSQPGVSKRLALKRIRTDRSADPAFVARFFDEARLAMQLSHANIVQVFDFGRLEKGLGDGEFFLAMEFVEGVDLQRLRRMDRHRTLPPAEALYVVSQVLRGLDYAHRRTDAAGQPLNIVHLDVKPANVLLSFEGEVKLTDFGVARSRDAQRPQVGISGTVPFMSPEQARGQKLDVRSDVFSAGLLLFALVAGASPWGEEDDEATLLRVRSGRADLKGLPLSELREILTRALAPSPDDRFPTAGAFADALEELVFAQGWRGGAAALRDRLGEAFPGERVRLNSLFAPSARQSGLQVASEGTVEGTLLSRIPEEELAPLMPKRQTVVAVEEPRRNRAIWVVLPTVALLGALGLSGVYRVSPANSAGLAPDAASPPPASAAAEPDAAAREAPDASDTAAPLPGPDGGTPVPAARPLAVHRPEKAAMGTLSVNASPWGTVTVNGKPAGTTPLLKFPVRAGQTAVVIENPKLGRRQISVKVLPNQDTPLIVDLKSGEQAK